MLRLGTSLAALLFALVASATFAPTLHAQDLEEDPASDPELGGVPSPEETAAAAQPEETLLSDEQALEEEQTGVESGDASTDPFEDPTENYYFAGLFYRHIFVPEFFLKLFLDEATGASNPAFGGEFTYRKDGFDIIGSLFWASFAADGPFKASGDPAQDTEFINSDLSAIFATATFLWSTAFNEVFALEYGVGIGVGVILGDVVRTEAYPAGGGYRPCVGPSNPNPEFCDPTSVGDGEDGGHYGVTARKWSDGGSVPNVVPWLAVPHLALRIKPIKQLMMRVEGGFGLGFFTGFSASYGF